MEKDAKLGNAETASTVQPVETLSQTIRRSLAVPSLFYS